MSAIGDRHAKTAQELSDRFYHEGNSSYASSAGWVQSLSRVTVAGALWRALDKADALMMAVLIALWRDLLKAFAAYGSAWCGYSLDPHEPTRWREEDLSRLLGIPLLPECPGSSAARKDSRPARGTRLPE